MKEDPIVQRHLDRTAHLPQFERVGETKFRYCRLCGARVEAGEPYHDHVRRHH